MVRLESGDKRQVWRRSVGDKILTAMAVCGADITVAKCLQVVAKQCASYNC